MRFDDRLATVLAQSRSDKSARVAAWRQCLDILAQSRAAEDPLVPQARALLTTLREAVPAAVREEAAAGLLGRSINPEIVAVIGDDVPRIAAVLIGRVELTDADWLRLLPGFPPTTRALLRQRRDLSPVVRAALASLGPGDLALPAAVRRVIDEEENALGGADPHTAGANAHATGAETVQRQSTTEMPPAPLAGDEETAQVAGTRIADLLARIARYRHEAASTPPQAFRFETGVDGVIRWVEGAPRAIVAGVSIAHVGNMAEGGVDGQATGAFRHRAPFRDARLTLVGSAATAGAWRIAGVPLFDPVDGRFTGYRGTARRPWRHEQAASPMLVDDGLPGDALRQLVHEFRTPLNAVIGFGEMIDREMMGSAAPGYRRVAGAIVAEGHRLLGILDDLDGVGRFAASRAGAGHVDPVALLERLGQAYCPITEARAVTLTLAVAGEIGGIAGDPAATERMVARLLAATLGVSAPGETIAAELSQVDGRVALRMTRPVALASFDETVLLDPGFSPEGDFPDAPLLGLGFTLRLVRNLAAAAGGALEVARDRFVLHLPADVALVSQATPC